MHFAFMVKIRQNTVLICWQCEPGLTKNTSLACIRNKCVMSTILFSKNLSRSFVIRNVMETFLSPLEILELKDNNRALATLQNVVR